MSFHIIVGQLTKRKKRSASNEIIESHCRGLQLVQIRYRLAVVARDSTSQRGPDVTHRHAFTIPTNACRHLCVFHRHKRMHTQSIKKERKRGKNRNIACEELSEPVTRTFPQRCLIF